MQEVFGDSLLSAPLDKAETELPSPERLKRRIILKHKKLPPEGVKEETVAVSNALVDPTNTNDDVHGMDIAHSVLSGILYLQVRTSHNGLGISKSLFCNEDTYLQGGSGGHGPGLG